MFAGPSVFDPDVRVASLGLAMISSAVVPGKLQIDAGSFRSDYLSEIEAFCEMYRRECFQNGVDYVQIDTSMQFDRALTEYLVSRRRRS